MVTMIKVKQLMKVVKKQQHHSNMMSFIGYINIPIARDKKITKIIYLC